MSPPFFSLLGIIIPEYSISSFDYFVYLHKKEAALTTAMFFNSCARLWNIVIKVTPPFAEDQDTPPPVNLKEATS